MKEDRTQCPKVGDTLHILPSKFRDASTRKIVYEVLSVELCEQNGKLTKQNHGALIIKLLSEKNHPSVLEQIEHYCLYNWHRYFEIIDTVNKNQYAIQKYHA